jgi:hypothetical protein
MRLLPLTYRLPARFDTIPFRPISHALAKTSGPSASIASLPFRLAVRQQLLHFVLDRSS